jgi:acid-sensing ion channel, other
MFNEESNAFKTCDCLPSCNSIDYSYNFFIENINKKNENNLSTVSIYFADDEFIVLKRSATFGTVTLLSNIGGLLGLFLGVSVLSAVEVFYFFVIRFINNLWCNHSN